MLRFANCTLITLQLILSLIILVENVSCSYGCILQNLAKEIDRYIGWLIFLADTDTDISVSVSIISVSAKTISVSTLVLIEISVSVFYWYRPKEISI